MKIKIVGILVCTLIIATAVPAVNSLNNIDSYAEPSSTAQGGSRGPWNLMQDLNASDGAPGDWFGASISVNGDTAFIGAWYDDPHGSNSGSVYVFTRTGTTWSFQQNLNASDGAAEDEFGSSVSIDGDYALIGAGLDDDQGANSGSVYVFHRTGTTWSFQQKLLAPDGEYSDGFGVSVSLSGDTALIGANGDDGVRGSSYVFTRPSGTWSFQQKLYTSDWNAIEFGMSVSLDGDTALIGAFQDDGNAAESGSAFVFTRTGSIWTQQQQLNASDGAAGDLFGYSVSLSGDTALIGAPLGDGQAIDSGSAYVFTRTGTTWTQKQNLNASDGAFYDWFGWSVSLDGDTALIGANQDDDNGFASGSAFVFTLTGPTWIEQQKLLASDGVTMDQCGYSVFLDGDTAFIGIPNHDAHGHSSGSVYVFTKENPPGPDLIIRDRSTGTLILIGDNIYDRPNWPAVTQIGKWTFQLPGLFYHWYTCWIMLQNDDPTVPLVGHTIETVLINGATGTIGGLLYRNTGNTFTSMPIGQSTIDGAQILPGASRWLKLTVGTPNTGVNSLKVGIHVISTSGAEDAIIFMP